MRLRNNPNAESHLSSHEDFVDIRPEQTAGLWRSRFQNDAPLHLEIGMGKGDFIIGHALRDKDINFIGMEKYATVMDKALLKLERQETFPDNLRFLKDDAVNLDTLFAPGELDTIYLNFSDPWPKKKHAKRRLTYRTYLEKYIKVLKAGGDLIFKTDNRSLFEYSLVSIPASGFIIDDVSLDLHHSEGYDDNIMTEYERKFSKNGPIYYLRAHTPEGK